MSLAGELLLGVRMALSFNPLVSIVAAPVVAALAARSERRHSLLGLPGVVLLAAWVLGDGYTVALFVRDVLGRSGAGASAGAAVAPLLGAAVWAAGALAVGYALPAWAGAFVGRRVTHGTGWASAAVIALAAAGAIAGVLGRLG